MKTKLSTARINPTRKNSYLSIVTFIFNVVNWGCEIMSIAFQKIQLFKKLKIYSLVLEDKVGKQMESISRIDLIKLETYSL